MPSVPYDADLRQPRQTPLPEQASGVKQGQQDAVARGGLEGEHLVDVGLGQDALGDLLAPEKSGGAALGHAKAFSALPAWCRTQPDIGTDLGWKRQATHVTGARLRFGFRVLAGDQQFGGTGSAGPVPNQPAMILLWGFRGPAIVTRKPNNPLCQHHRRFVCRVK